MLAKVRISCDFWCLAPHRDGVPPTPRELEIAATLCASVAASWQSKKSGLSEHQMEQQKKAPFLIHCAHGRGRSTTALCAALVQAGYHRTWQDAYAFISTKTLRQAQREDETGPRIVAGGVQQFEKNEVREGVRRGAREGGKSGGCRRISGACTPVCSHVERRRNTYALRPAGPNSLHIGASWGHPGGGNEKQRKNGPFRAAGLAHGHGRVRGIEKGNAPWCSFHPFISAGLPFATSVLPR